MKSTLSTFRVIWVVSMIWVDWFAYIYAMPIRWLVGFPIYMQWPFACLARGLGLF